MSPQPGRQGLSEEDHIFPARATMATTHSYRTPGLRRQQVLLNKWPMATHRFRSDSAAGRALSSLTTIGDVSPLLTSHMSGRYEHISAGKRRNVLASVLDMHLVADLAYSFVSQILTSGFGASNNNVRITATRRTMRPGFRAPLGTGWDRDRNLSTRWQEILTR